MSVRGDVGYYPKRMLLGPKFLNSMTAIYRVYTPEGFVIAADGRKTGEHPTDDAQKIFRITEHLSCAFQGNVELWDDSAGTLTFDLLKETHTAFETISTADHESIHQYGEALSTLVQSALSRVYRPELLQEKSDTDLGAILIDGYVSGYPSNLRIEFRRSTGGELLDPLVESTPRPMGIFEANGVKIVNEAWSTNASWLAAYYLPATIHPLPALNEQAVLALTYIKACCGKEANAADPKGAATVGGKIHMATITPDKGFQWIPGYEPSSTHL